MLCCDKFNQIRNDVFANVEIRYNLWLSHENKFAIPLRNILVISKILVNTTLVYQINWIENEVIRWDSFDISIYNSQCFALNLFSVLFFTYYGKMIHFLIVATQF